MALIRGSTVNYGSQTGGGILVYGASTLNHQISLISQIADLITLDNTELIASNQVKLANQVMECNKHRQGNEE